MVSALRIGELARQTNCPIGTIRYYEREGLLPAPQRTEGNYRLYQRTHVERLRFIRQCRSLDMALEEIRTLLRFRDAPHQDCAGVNALLDEHIGHVSRRIAEMRAMQRHLKQLRNQCITAKAAKDCGILNELAQPNDCGAPLTTNNPHVRATHAHTRKPL